MKKLMRKAHQLTKEIKAEFPEVNYSAQLGLCITYLIKEGNEMELPILTGSEKQIAWATEIRTTNLRILNEEIEVFKGRELRENCSYGVIIEKAEKAINEIQKTEKTAKWWIEHQNLANAYMQKIKQQ